MVTIYNYSLTLNTTAGVKTFSETIEFNKHYNIVGIQVGGYYQENPGGKLKDFSFIVTQILPIEPKLIPFPSLSPGSHPQIIINGNNTDFFKPITLQRFQLSGGFELPTAGIYYYSVNFIAEG